MIARHTAKTEAAAKLPSPNGRCHQAPVRLVEAKTLSPPILESKHSFIPSMPRPTKTTAASPRIPVSQFTSPAAAQPRTYGNTPAMMKNLYLTVLAMQATRPSDAGRVGG
jgi:hypothetical protein